ncbi:hypothetical protein GGR58DRAFT_28125 [Xylaria digitata]|nr:hypothetical protein GGR58DRAFT_28125 [Xylaria digitata]
MEVTKIFALGSTGYIGSDATYTISQKHPEYQWTCLVRNAEKGVQISALIPGVTLVYGDYNNCDLLAEEAAKADIVLNWAASGNEQAVKAIFQGLSARSSTGFYIHTSGTAILEDDDMRKSSFGKDSDKVYDDFSGINDVKIRPKESFIGHPEDPYVWSGNISPNLKTAIVCPPLIYGETRGPGAENSIMVSLLSSLILQRGHGLQIGEGKSKWCEVHVQDLSNVYLRLVEEAVKGGGSATWDAEGFYFAEAGEFVWGQISTEIARVAYDQGFIKSTELESIHPSEAEKLSPHALILWGMNSRSRALRSRKLLGWEPTMPSLVEDIPRVVQTEAAKLGLQQKRD